MVVKNNYFWVKPDSQAGFIANGDIDHGCFLLTAAYVFSLEAGITQAMEAKEILINHGREE